MWLEHTARNDMDMLLDLYELEQRKKRNIRTIEQRGGI